MSKHELNSFVSKKINSYGNSGVWGTAQTEPDHGLEYVGSWDASKPFGDNSDKKKANALLDGVVILYRIPDKVSENGNQHYQFWLWAGVGPSKAEQSAKSDIPSFDNLEAQINFKDKSYKMGAYSPGRSFASGPVSVSAQSPDVTDLAAKFPLNKGHVKFDPDSKVGSGGMYGVQWDGNYAGTQSINATCEASWPTDQKPKFDWTLRLSAKDSLF
ncbi:hypothetical protein A4G99_00040 [Haladaptatus sp. R4]|nr:hypothetical protein A4G99_00040 [Haladaptatus sp. R4]